MNRKWTVIVLAVLLMGGGLALGYPLLFSPRDVESEVVSERTVERWVSGTGHLYGEREEKILARYNMVIDDIPVKAGDRVSAGDQLARGDTVELEQEKRNLEVERDMLARQIASSRAAFSVQLESAQGRLEAARAQLFEAEREHLQMERLFEAGVIAEKTLRDADLAVSGMRAQVAEARAALEEVKRQERQLEVEAERLVTLDEQISVLKRRIDQHIIVVQDDWIIGERFIDPGQPVSAGTPLFRLHNEVLRVKMDLLAKDAREVALGQSGIISGDALNDDEWEAVVSEVAPRAVEQVSELGVRQQRVPVELLMKTPPEGARPGYPVDIDIRVATETGLAIERDAVFELDGADHVFRVEGNLARLRSIETGLEGEDHILVIAGLAAGDQVVLNPSDELSDGDRVRMVSRNDVEEGH